MLAATGQSAGTATNELTEDNDRRTVMDWSPHPLSLGTTSVMSASPPPAQESPVRRRAEGRGYAWALALTVLAYVALMAFVGFGFFTVPGSDAVRQGGWFFAIGLMVITPAAIVVALLSCAVVAIIRKLGGRYLPGIVQAIPAVAVVGGLIYLMFSWLFAPVE